MSLAARFMALFDGLRRAHGRYPKPNTVKANGKHTNTNPVTLPEPVTEALWQTHLDGVDGIGIVPIRDDSTVVFGAIDVDVYDGLDCAQVAATIERLGLPLVTCRSKSGGVHLYLFTAEPVPASHMVDRLRELAALLGYGSAEIFPKQVSMNPESKDFGSWINAPYFCHAETNRYAIRADGSALTAEEFLTWADSRKVAPNWFEQPLSMAGAPGGSEKKPSQKDSPLPDAPPCLQNLIQIGFPEGTRNVGLFNLGVYYRKSRPHDWAEQIEAANTKWLKPALPASEVGPTIRTLRAKEYTYQCTKQPLMGHCNAVECRRRKYGVGGKQGSSFPILGELRKLLTDPPVWYLDVKIPPPEGAPEGQKDREGTLELTTEDLMTPKAFQAECVNKLNAMPVMPSNQVWTSTVQMLLAKVVPIELPNDADSGAEGLFWELLEDFCTGRAQAQSWEEVLLGKPYTEDGRTYFRSRDLLDWLTRKGFKEWKLPQLTKVLRMRTIPDPKNPNDKDKRKAYCRHKFEVINGKGCNLWSVPAPKRDNDALPVPEAVKQTIF